jgi:hypothetical protein
MNDIPLHLLPSVKTPLGTLYLKLSREDAEKRVAALRVKAGRAQSTHDEAWDEYIAALAAKPQQPKWTASCAARAERLRTKCLAAAYDVMLAELLLNHYSSP